MGPRILQLVPSFGPGGAERQLAYLCRGLSDLGWDVQVGVLTDDTLGPEFRASGATLHWIDRDHRDPRLLLHLLRLIRRLRPQVVQTWIPVMDVVGGLAARLSGVPWILTERSSPLDFRLTAKFHARARLARGAACVVSNSDGGDRYWQRTLPPHVPRAVIPNALPLDEIAAATPASDAGFGLDPEAPLVVYVGRIMENKNILTLVETLARVFAETECVAVFCGQGPQQDDLRRWIDERGLGDRVATPGFVSPVWPLLRRAAAFISLSRYEGMPNAVMEAMACGCPVVVSDIPAHRALLDEEVAAIVPTEDVESAAGALIATLRDPVAARARAGQARERAAGWSIPAFANRYAALYRQATEGRK